MNRNWRLIWMNDQEATKRSEEISKFFQQLLKSFGEDGDIGFTRFRTVFEELMPIQKEKLRRITGTQFDILMDQGSMISIGVTYRDPILD